MNTPAGGDRRADVQLHAVRPAADLRQPGEGRQVNLIDAAADLYSSFARTFRKVILPLSLPGVFAGTLLTFIPASGDFINNELLGNAARQPVIGGVIQTRFLDAGDYPTAAAISFVLMAMITAAVLVYAKFLGTEDLA